MGRVRSSLDGAKAALRNEVTVVHDNGSSTTTSTRGGVPVARAIEFLGEVKSGDPTKRRIVAAVGAAALVVREVVFHPLDLIPGLAGVTVGLIRGIKYNPESGPQSTPNTARKVGFWTMAAISPLGVAGYLLGRQLVSSIRGKIAS